MTTKSTVKSKSRRSKSITGTGNPLDYYGLRWLFDEDNPDHISIEDRVQQFKQRDLAKTKLFVCATNLFWAPRSRKRVILASSGYRRKPETTSDSDKSESPVITHNITGDSVKQPCSAVSLPIPSVLKDNKTVDHFEYRSWIATRKELNSDISLLGLNEDYLTRKPGKTPLEKNVLKKLVDKRKNNEESIVKN